MSKTRLIQTNLNKWINYHKRKNVVHSEQEDVYIDIYAKITIKPRVYNK